MENLFTQATDKAEEIEAKRVAAEKANMIAESMEFFLECWEADERPRKEKSTEVPSGGITAHEEN